VLKEAILAAAVNSDEAEALGENGHGTVYVLRFPFDYSEPDCDDLNGLDHPA
jgi:hypothetical protein